MTDAGSAIKTAYVALLANLTYQDKPVEVYAQMAPSGAVAPYVILGSWVSNSDNTKTSQGQIGQVTLQVIDRMPDALYSEVRTNAIANMVTTLLKPDVVAEPLEIAGFSHWSVIRSVAELMEPNAKDTVYRKIITVEHSLLQL